MKTYKMLLIGLVSSVVSATAFATCDSAKQEADKACDELIAQLAKSNADMSALSGMLDQNNVGAAKTGMDGQAMGAKAQAAIQAALAKCTAAQQKCNQTCKSEQSQKQSEQDYAGAQQAGQNDNYCKSQKPEQAKKSGEKASGDLSKMMDALGKLLAALGAQQNQQQQPEQPLCTREPKNPACTVDKSSSDGGSTFTSGEFRRDDGASSTDGGLANGADPAMGTPASSSGGGSGFGAGAGSVGSMGTASSGGNKYSKDNSSKKSSDDGTPKINMASGYAGGAGGGGGRGGGGLGGHGGGNGSSPSRSSVDQDQQAGRIAAAAEERLRGPASNEPLGGISSVYYLDNFTKIEKRIQNERNTLFEN